MTIMQSGGTIKWAVRYRNLKFRGDATTIDTSLEFFRINYIQKHEPG